MLDLANIAISIVKKSVHCYFEEKDVDYLLAQCIYDDIPIIGLENADWVNSVSIINEHYQFFRLSEATFIVYGKLTVRETLEDDEYNDVEKNITISCKLNNSDIMFTSVHLSQTSGNVFATQNETSERVKFYRDAIKCLYEVFVEYDNNDTSFVYDPDAFNQLFETDAYFVNIDQMFWFMCTECVHPDDTEKLDVFRNIDIEKRLQTNECKIQFEVRIKNKKKGYKWIEMVIILFPNSVYKLDKIFYLMRDIDDKKRMELENKVNARKDPLTDVLNRRYSEAMIKVAIRENEGISALAIVDIDNFKKINDTFGHMSGDDVLKKIVNKINTCIENRDVIGRLGGDEFILFVRNRNSVDEIYEIMENIIKETRMKHEEYNTSMDIHISVGVATFENNDMEFENLYKASDEALYEVKNSNKNAFVLKRI